MMQNEILTTNLAAIGEEIGQELGAKMVKDFQDAYPTEVPAYQIGRNIIGEILAQPGCVGIRFYMGLNEVGQKTLVYVGVDQDDNLISEYQLIDNKGELATQKGIVADRSTIKDKPSTTTTLDWFS